MATKRLVVELIGDSRSLDRAMGNSTKKMSAFGAAAKRTGQAAAGILPAIAVKQTVEFDKSMRNVNSIAQLGEKRFQNLSKSVLSLAGPTAQAPDALAKGLYDLVSSGFSANESLKILKKSALAATAGLTTTEVSTKAVAAVLNAYRLPAAEAGKVSDQLFRTVDRGVISFEALSTEIGDVLPFAASLGVGLDQVGASIATMTKAGISAPETMTRIKSLMVTMLKPGTDLKAAFKSLGVESGEALIKQKGFQGALQALIGTTDGSKKAVAALFPEIRAMGGALALTGKNSRGARKDLDGMRQSAGATGKALSQQSKSISFQWRKLKSQLSAVAIEIGTTLIPILTKLVGVALTVQRGVSKSFRAVGRLLVEVWQAPKRAFGNFFASMLRGFAKIFDTASKLPVVGDKFDGVAEKTRAWAEELDRIGEKVEKPLKVTVKFVSSGLSSIQGAIDSIPTRRGGGMAAGLAAVSPGEMLAFPDGRTGMVPGARTAADSVLTSLPAGTAVFTGHGQSMLDQGASMGQALAAQLPHFRAGGQMAKRAGRQGGGRIAGMPGIFAREIRRAGLRGREAATFFGAMLRANNVEAGSIGGNPSGGMEDSAGPFQIRAMHGPYSKRRNPAWNARWFIEEARQLGAYHPKISGAGLAAAVERPASQYRFKYGSSQYVDEARIDALVAQFRGGAGGGAGGGGRRRLPGYRPAVPDRTIVTQPRITKPLLGNMLDPLVEGSLGSGIAAGMEGSSRRPLLTSVLEGLAPESTDRPTRRTIPGRPAVPGRRPTRSRRGGKRGGAGGFKPGGGWGGSKNLVMKAIRGYREHNGYRATFKRPYNTGTGLSDHYTGSTRAFAADMAPGDDVFATVRRRLGIAARKGSWNKFENQPVSGYRAQLLWHAPDGTHQDHVHLGIAAMRRGGIVGFGKGGVKGRGGLFGKGRAGPIGRSPRRITQLRGLGGNPGVEGADKLTRSYARTLRRARPGQLLAQQAKIKQMIRKMAKEGFTGGERIQTRRLRGALSLVQDELGRDIGRPLGATDRLQERLGRAESRLPDEMAVAGIDPESAAGIALQRGQAAGAVGSLQERRGRLSQALRIAKRTKDKDAIRQVRSEIQEVDDQILGYRAQIKALDTNTAVVEANTEAADAALEAQEAHTAAINAQAEEMKGLRDELKRQNDFSVSVANVTSKEAVRALADVISSGIGQTYSQRRASAGAGAMARW